MPLVKSASKSAMGTNIKREMAAGKPQKQAIAIAYSVKRRAGGTGGKPSPVQAPPGRVQKAPGKLHDKSHGYLGRSLQGAGGGSVPDFAGRPTGNTTGHGLPVPRRGRGGGSTGRRAKTAGSY